MRPLVPLLLFLAACDDAPCGDFDPDDCPTNRCSVHEGARLDLDAGCVAETRAFCVEGTSHDGAIGIGLDPDGGRWWFPTTTVPEGWATDALTPADDEAHEAGICP